MLAVAVTESRSLLLRLLGQAELVNMKSSRQGQTTSDPSAKDKSKKDDKTAQGISVKSKATRGLSCRKSGTSVGKVAKQRCKTTGNTHMLIEVPIPVSVQSPLEIQKFQLQLFPMDEPTRKRLEEENHCPYLELTITTKKKMASVIRHLNMKWGNSRSSLEELFLFPYNRRVESLESYKRWTLKDSDITAAEVHAAIGKPAVFRLRYGWLSIYEPKISNLPRTYLNLVNQPTSKEIQNKDVDDQEKEPSTGVSLECEPLLKQDVLETAPMKTIQAANNPRPDNDVNLSWVDCVSNMSFGALLSEVEAAEGAKLRRQAPQKQISISCDSFDAAIAAHIVRYQTGNQSTTMAQPSILDAEETCNPFSFHNFTSLNKNIRVQSQVFPISSTIENAQHHGVKLCNVPSPPVEPFNTTLTSQVDAQPIQEVTNNQLVLDWQGNNKQDKEDMQVDINATNNVNNQFEGLDMHWPPSVEPWQIVASSSQQIISSDSNGLNGFACTSLDIF